MSFRDIFGTDPAATASAPGRVNLLGEHTDYNEGFVLPTAIPQMTTVAVRPSGGGEFVVHSANLATESRFERGETPGDHFARYVHGCIRGVEAHGVEVPVLDIHVRSDVPIGVGLSSSAALEVATLRALRALLRLDIDDVEIARLAQHAEIDFAGVNCGIMDQMASSLADARSMLFLDTRTLERRIVQVPAGCELLVLDSGISRSLAASGYNERRAECESAARALGVAALRDVVDPASLAALPEPLRRRARHVVTENARVLQAAAGVDAETFGRLMDDSHASLRDDYDVSTPALDRMVALLQAEADVYGARLTGAGFGGACVALCRQGSAAGVAHRVLGAYACEGYEGRQLVPPGEAA